MRWLLRRQTRLLSWTQQWHGLLSKSRSGGFSREAFGWRSVHSFSGARLCSNGSMVELSHERYLQWQQHKAPGAQKHLMPEEPFFPLAQNRNNNAAKTCGGVIWCCCHCLLHTMGRFLNCTPATLRISEAASPSPKPCVCSDRMSCHGSCVVMHFCWCNDSVGIFLLPKAILRRLRPLPHTEFAKHLRQSSISPDNKNVYISLITWREITPPPPPQHT